MNARYELGIVSDIPLPRPRNKVQRQLEECKVGDSFLTRSSQVYEIARKLGIQIKTQGGGRTSDRYYRVWKIKDAHAPD